MLDVITSYQYHTRFAYYALKFTNFKAQLKLYVHFTHAYTFIFIYNRIYFIMIIVI